MKFVVFFNHLLNPGLSGMHTLTACNMQDEETYQLDKTTNDEVIFTGTPLECVEFLDTLPTDDQPANEIEITLI